jgi:hypothetical protein
MAVKSLESIALMKAALWREIAINININGVINNRRKYVQQ